MCKKRTILITGIGGDIAQSIIKCLRDTNYRFTFIGCDIDLYASGRQMVDKFLIAPKVLEEKKYFDFIKAVVKKYKIQYIFPTTEIEIIFFDAYREFFDNKKVIVFINNSSIINNFFDKYKTVKYLESIGIVSPKTFLIEEYNNQLNYPLIIKARQSCGAKEVIKIENEEEFNLYKKKLKNTVVQEYLGNEEDYTTGVFSDGKKVFTITFKRKLGFGGVTKFAELICDDNEIQELAERIAKATNLMGSINIQSKKTTRGHYIFEINPRFSSTVYFRHRFGFQDVKWWLEIKENKNRNIEYKPKYKKGIVVRTLTEIFFDKKV